MIEIDIKPINQNLPDELLKAIKQFIMRNFDQLIDKIADIYTKKILKDEHDILPPTRVAATLASSLLVDICNYSDNFAPGFEPTDYKPTHIFVNDAGYTIIVLRNKIGHTVHLCAYLFNHTLADVSKDRADTYLTIYTMITERINKKLESG